MATIEKTVEIPADHRLELDLPVPADIPAGRAKIKVTIIPYPEEIEPIEVPQPPSSWENLRGALKDSKTFAGDAVELQRRMRGYYDDE